jgi:hypothetical protein
MPRAQSKANLSSLSRGGVALFTAILLAPHLANANSELHFGGGALLPSGIPGVTEVMPTVGLRASRQTSKGTFELDGMFSNASGASYRSVSVDYRLDLPNDALPVLLLIGLHGDYYQGAESGPAKFSRGGHFGAGVFMPMTSMLLLRSDFRYRLGPGTSLLVTVGLTIRFGG